jgi:hypothetical protein
MQLATLDNPLLAQLIEKIGQFLRSFSYTRFQLKKIKVEKIKFSAALCIFQSQNSKIIIAKIKYFVKK